MGGTSEFPHQVAPPLLAEDQVQLFIFAKSPESFSLSAGGLGKEMGYTLYHLGVSKPEVENE